MLCSAGILAEGQTSRTWQLPGHSPLTTLPLCSHRLLFVRVQQQPETKSFVRKKAGQGQPPATPDSNPAHSGNRKHFLGRSRYSTACFNHPSRTHCLGKGLSAGALHQPAAWRELAPAVRTFQKPVKGLECSHCRWLTRKSPKELQSCFNLWAAVPAKLSLPLLKHTEKVPHCNGKDSSQLLPRWKLEVTRGWIAWF